MKQLHNTSFKNPMDELIRRFDASVGVYWAPHACPTSESLQRVKEHLGIVPPAGLCEFAKRSNSFSSFFLGIGPDYGSHSHIITRNDYWRSPETEIALPEHLVMFTDGFMDNDFWCFDKTSFHDGEYLIQYWAPDVEPVDFPQPYKNFAEFINSTVEFYEGKRA